MSKEKETDAATALSQMSQLVPFHLTTSLSSPDPEAILETDAIGATCTLHPSSLDTDMLFPLQDEQLSEGDRNVRSDPYISFDDADHPYAVNSSETSHMMERHRFTKHSSTTFVTDISSFDGTEHPYASKLINYGASRSKAKPYHISSLHFSATGRRPHSCEQCMKSFTTKSDLKRHMKIHLKNQLEVLSCDLCMATFRDQATKTRHLKIHNKRKNFQCKKCQKEFSRCDSYKNHLSIHAASKRFKCNICYSEFNYKSSFNRHVSAHKTDSLFICDICGKAFHRQDYVDSHKKIVHQQLSETNSKVRIFENVTLNIGVNKRNKGKLRMAKLVPEKSHLESGEAIPILMSMAEQAANSNFKKPRQNLGEELSNGNLINDNVNIPFSSPQIDQEFISYLDDASNDSVSECVSIPTQSLKLSINHGLSPGQVS